MATLLHFDFLSFNFFPLIFSSSFWPPGFECFAQVFPGVNAFYAIPFIGGSQSNCISRRFCSSQPIHQKKWQPFVSINSSSMRLSMAEYTMSGSPAFSMGSVVQTPELLKRWYAAGASAEDKVSFDNLCRSSFHAALDSISPSALSASIASCIVAAEQQQVEAIAAPFLEELKSNNDAAAAGQAPEQSKH